jgi:hypothetical protein
MKKTLSILFIASVSVVLISHSSVNLYGIQSVINTECAANAIAQIEDNCQYDLIKSTNESLICNAKPVFLILTNYFQPLSGILKAPWQPPE